MNKNEQWKAEIRQYAKQCGVSPQAVLTEIMLERFLERLSQTSFRNLFIIKGGVLVESLVGISFRTTMDLDITIQNYPLDE